MINSKWGFNKYSNSYPVFNIKPKKYNYDKYNEASAKAYKVIKSYSDFIKAMDSPRTYDFNNTLPDSITSQFPVLEEVIAVWQEELKEADYDNKKARINEKIASSTLINIALCQFVLGQYDKSIATLNTSQELKGKDAWASMILNVLESVKADMQNYKEKTNI